MVRPQSIVEAVSYTLQQDDSIPSETNFLENEPDIENDAIKLPVIEISSGAQARLSESNSDFVTHKLDGDGNQIGRVYELLYTLEITIAVWTADGSMYNAKEIGDSVRDALYKHDTAGADIPLENPDGTIVDDVWRFSVDSGEQTDDFSTSPTLRRWQQEVLVSAGEKYTTEEEYITDTNVQTPE